MLNLIRMCCACLLLTFGVAHAQTLVPITFEHPDGQTGTINATLRVPLGPAHQRAVVILHGGGGWESAKTAQYAQFLSERGFVTLEPRLFVPPAKPMSAYIGQVFGALAYLAKLPMIDPGQISVIGFSFGASLSTLAATQWAQRQYASAGPTFRSHAAFYPVCWPQKALIERRAPKAAVIGFPEDAMDRWLGHPIQIFAAGADDYDDRDPTMCKQFVAAIPDAAQRAMVSVQVFEKATHSWDEPSHKTRSPYACKGKGCEVDMVNDPTVTQAAQEELLAFLMK